MIYFSKVSEILHCVFREGLFPFRNTQHNLRPNAQTAKSGMPLFFWRIRMFKKTMIAAALGALSFSALGADVNVYGVIDTGFAFEKAKIEVSETDRSYTYEDDSSFSMASGTNSANRIGLKGTEDLGNGLKVGFVLENGFDSDSGELGDSGLIFNRQATLSVQGDFGTVYAGRMGGLISDTGSVGFYGAMASALGSGWSSNIAGHTFVMANYTARRDNTLTYVSPEFAGATVYAQYAMGDNSKENKPSTDRYAALGAKWAGGPFTAGVLVDWTNKDSSPVVGMTDYSIEDAYTFNLAGSYDCGFATTYLAVQYFKDAADAASIGADYFDAVGDEYARLFSMTGYAAHLSTSFEALGGTVKAGVGYMDGEVDANVSDVYFDGDIKAYTASVGYEYALSKRTTVYTGAGYTQRELDYSDAPDSSTNIKIKGLDVVAGLVHRF